MILVLAVASAPAAWSWRGLPGKVLAVLPPLVLGAAAYTYAPSPLLLVLAALVAHATSFVAPEPARASTRVGRELLLVGAAVLLAFGPGPLGYVIAIAIGLHAIAAQRTVRHVYFVELLVVGLYATLTRSLDLAPVLEAMLGLGYGFTLLGGATLTRRLGLTDVEIATRRFLAVLPVLVGLLTLEAAPSDTTALFALVASVLYATAAFTNESRAFAAAAAVAANGALVFFALAQGLDGIEIWLAPLGLVVAIMAQIFAPSLPPSARNILRVAGGVLLYLPAGLKLVRGSAQRRTDVRGRLRHSVPRGHRDRRRAPDPRIPRARDAIARARPHREPGARRASRSSPRLRAPVRHGTRDPRLDGPRDAAPR